MDTAGSNCGNAPHPWMLTQLFGSNADGGRSSVRQSYHFGGFAIINDELIFGSGYYN